jgi:hypothetical protein
MTQSGVFDGEIGSMAEPISDEWRITVKGEVVTM